MATIKKLSGGKIPEGYESPFKRVQMEERNDDALACIATLSGRTLAEITKLAVQLGYPSYGPAFVDNALITKLLYNLGLTGGEYAEVSSIDALPDVALLSVDYQPDSDVGRHIVWHHIRGIDGKQAFSYVIDPGNWLDPKHHITSDFNHLRLDPAWYIEVTPRANGKAKGK